MPTSSRDGHGSSSASRRSSTRSSGADDVLAGLTEEEKVEALAAHPAIGQQTGLSTRSAAEQGTDDDPCLLVDFAALNAHVREEVRLPLRRVREPPPEDGDPRRPARAHRAHARRGARHRLPRARRDREGSLDPYLKDVLDVLLRMLHVVAGIAWIGASFYFVRLDLSLRAPKRREDAEAGVAGEFWGVHGGGLYHSQKYRLAPPEMPEPLHWFKWEAYTTWLSGLRALRPPLLRRRATCGWSTRRVADLDEWQAIALSLAGIALAWLVYDVLCRTVGQRSQAALAVIGDRARGAGRLGRGRAVRAARRLPPGRRDARDDHGRERLRRDHPGAPEARRGDGGAARARRRAAARGEEPVGAQQLPHAAGALHDARRPLRVRVRRGRGVARVRRDRGADRADPRLLQPLARRAARVVDPGASRPSRVVGARALAAARGDGAGDGRQRHLRAGRARDRRALRAVSLGCVARHSGSGSRRARRSRRGSTTSSARRCRPARCLPGTRRGSRTTSASCSAPGSRSSR